MRQVVFYPDAFKQFTDWTVADKKLFKRLVRLIDETQRNPFDGIGKPEPLKHDYAGYWSRRIDQEHRLVYKATDKQVIIISCKYHY